MNALARLAEGLRFCRSVFREIELAYLRWALSEINPLHYPLTSAAQSIVLYHAFIIALSDMP